ncbi:MAG: hypothetical protein ACXVPQ_03550 [Bacteroidia bacterium]
MKVTKDRIISVCTLVGSLATYYYGKAHEKDVVPYVMVGGFIGAIVGEVIASATMNDQ